MNEAKIFSKGAPFILCGDFNSQPNSLVHQYLVKGYVNAKLVAPWYFSLSLESEPYSIQNGVKSKDDAELLGSDMNQLSISNNGKQLPPPLVRYMLDFTLNRFCRWLRILGLDAALETEAEERLRTKEAKL